MIRIHRLASPVYGSWKKAENQPSSAFSPEYPESLTGICRMSVTTGTTRCRNDGGDGS
jgi:hypothetical protein